MSEHGAPQMSVEALYAQLISGASVQVVDVRDDWEWAQGHVAGAVHIPLAELPRRLGEIDPTRPVAFICHMGGRSAMAARYAHQHGLAGAANVVGGMESWQARGYPVTLR
jgi:rhodanese-related sulfurtransferase